MLYSVTPSVLLGEMSASGHDNVIRLLVAQLKVSRDKLLAKLEKPACCTVSYSVWRLVTCPEVIVTGNDNVVDQQVAQLRVSRDKLLAELEKQFLEVDQLASENAALSQVCATGLASGKLPLTQPCPARSTRPSHVMARKLSHDELCCV